MLSRLLLGAVLASSFACSSSSGSPTALCGSGPNATLSVSVVNDTNEPMNICDAKVVATGPSTVTLAPTGGTSQASCGYSASVKAGDYTLTATATGYETTSVHQTVQAGCDVTTAIDVLPSM